MRRLLQMRKGRVTSGTSLSASDIPTLTLSKISDAGTVANKNTGIASGNIPIVGADGKLDATIMPAIAVTDTYVVASQLEMLALNAQTGDIAVRTDLKKSLILKVNNPTVLANWQELLTPTDVVTSVAGKTGTVTLTKSDVGLANTDDTADSSKSVASATKWTTARTLSLTGAVTGNVSIDGSGNASLATTYKDSGVTAGTYKSMTVDSKGVVTGGTNPTTLTGYGITDATPSSHIGTTGSSHG